jgi:Fur family transcriptional regulator, iron response regulator
MAKQTILKLSERLQQAGVPATLQRVAIAEVLLARPIHLRADQVLERVRETLPEMSRATVYNTLKIFRDAGLIKELVVDAERIVFDSNTSPHYHLYDVDTGTVLDVSADELKVIGSPKLPQGFALEQVDVIIRVRGNARPMPEPASAGGVPVLAS